MKVFLCYRRNDTQDVAGRICDWLRKDFGKRNVFCDTYSIQGGVNYPKVLTSAVENAAVVVCIIGPGWLGVRDRRGSRRLDDPNDPVRTELQLAIRRGIRVMPVLVRGAKMPIPEELPESLGALVWQHAVTIHDDLPFDDQYKRLSKQLKGNSRSPILIAGSAIGVIAAVGVAAIWQQRGSHWQPEPTLAELAKPNAKPLGIPPSGSEANVIAQSTTIATGRGDAPTSPTEAERTAVPPPPGPAPSFSDAASDPVLDADVRSRTTEALAPTPQRVELSPKAAGPSSFNRLPHSTALLERVYFEQSKAAIPTEAHAILNYVKERLVRDPRSSLVVEGHVDAAERAPIGLARAEEARRYLLLRGIAATRLSTKNAAASQPAASNSTEAGRAHNRRVDFWLLRREPAKN